MRRRPDRPTHSLDEVKHLAAMGQFTVNQRSLAWIRNHLGRFDGKSIIQAIIASVEADDFQKSIELKIWPGMRADVYRFVRTGDSELDGDDGWYLKVAIDNSGMLRLSVLSANWEGYYH